MSKLTTHEVLHRTGIKSAKTLTRWHQMALIPPPSIETHPNGRGKVAFWPLWIVFRIKEVQAGLDSGQSLAQLGDTLGSNWSAEEMRWIRKRPDIAAAFDRLNRHEATDAFSESTAEVVYDYLKRIGVQRPGSIFGRLQKDFSASSFIDRVRNLFRQEINPIAVITETAIKVIPDFQLASLFSVPSSVDGPLLVVPIGRAFLEAFADAEPDLTKKPKFVSALRVLEHGPKKTRERKYKPKGIWDFVWDE